MHDAVTSMGFSPSPLEEGTGRFRLAFARKSPGILPCFFIERALEFFGKGVDGVGERVGATAFALDSSSNRLMLGHCLSCSSFSFHFLLVTAAMVHG